jgi:hypothetical protein
VRIGRTFLIGLLLCALVDWLIHWAELVLGQRGHTAMANTSIPVGAFCALFALTLINLLLKRLKTQWALHPPEMLIIYIMLTTSTVISSSGALHFVIPSIVAPHHYATPENQWGELFLPFLPSFLIQSDPGTLHGFYYGNSTPNWSHWLPLIASWALFFGLLALTTISLMWLFHHQWSRRERLNFPTVQVPLALIQHPESLFRNRVFWGGFVIPLLVTIINTIHLNAPSVPEVRLRETIPNIQNFFPSPPWNAIGWMPMSFYPFAIGIGFLLSTEVTFSAWFFYLINRLELVYGSASGISEGGLSGQSVFPYLAHQGAGAFVALALLSIWLARNYLREVWRGAFHRSGDHELRSMRYAWLGFVLGFVGLTLFLAVSGMNILLALALLMLALLYLLAATRIRAETGNAWLWGPDVDPYRLITTSFGSQPINPQDLTALAVFRSSIGNNDLRCSSMPHQIDAFKMSEGMSLSRSLLAGLMMLAVLLGVVISFCMALWIWHHFGAEAKTEPWRTSMGRQPYDQLADVLKTPLKADLPGSIGTGLGFSFTLLLGWLRTRLNWFPFHPVGYAIAHTNTLAQTWAPFFVAWLAKTVILRYGGMALYRAALPFFLGLIAGDLIGGGLTTLTGCLFNLSAYPINW